MIDIKDISGNIKLSVPVSEKAVHKKELMKEDYILLTFNTRNIVDFNKGDNIEYEGKRYEIVTLSFPTETDNGYEYELKFDSLEKKWSNKILFYNRQYQKEKAWSLTSTLADFLEIVCANLKALGYKYNGLDYTYSISSDVASTSLYLSFDGQNIFDALTDLAEKWETEWWVTDNIIHFGKCEFGSEVMFEEGVNINGMTRSEGDSTSYVTRLYPFGSTRNIPSSYRPSTEGIVVEGVVEKRLMLPSGIDHIDAWENMSDADAVDGVVAFDDVYPKRVGTISEVTTKPCTNTDTGEDGKETITKWNAYVFKDSDFIFAKSYILPNVELKISFQSGSLAGMEFVIANFNETDQTFEIKRNDTYGINLPNDTLKPSVGDSYVLSGYDTSFVNDTLIPAAEQELLSVARDYLAKKSIDTSVYDCPTNKIRVRGIVDGIYSDSNVQDFEVGQKVFLKNSIFLKNGRSSRVYGYEKKLDDKFDCTYTVGESTKYSRIGKIEDEVKSITYKGQSFTGNSGNGIYLITKYDDTRASDSNAFSALRSKAEFLSKKEAGIAEEIITFLKGIKLSDKPLLDIIRSVDNSVESNTNVYSAAKSLLKFIKKDGDTVTGLLQLLKGLDVGGLASIDEKGDAVFQNLSVLIKAVIADLEVSNSTKTKELTVTDTATTLNLIVQQLAITYDLEVDHVATLFRTIVKDYISSENFVSGFAGQGMKIYKALNGDWNMEIDNLTVRKIFSVFELVVQKVVYQGGMVIRSAAGGKLTKVTDGGSYWRCEHDSANDFAADDQVLCQTFTGTTIKRYWRLVTSAGAGYFNLSKTDCEANSAIPETGDEVAVLGNRTVTARQSAQIDCAVGDTAPYRDDYEGINSYSLDGKLILRSGNLSGIVDAVFGALSGSGLYGKNVRLKGDFILESTGKSVSTELSDVKTTLSVLDGRITASVTETKSYADSVAAIAKKAAIDDAATKYTTKSDFSAQVDILSTQITTKVSQTDFNALGQRVSSAESTITQQAALISLKASQSDLNSLVTRVASAELKITSTAIISTVQSTINSAKDSAINTAAADATAKANAAQATAISSAAADATTKANNAQTNAINSAATDAINKVNAVQIGGRNLATGTAQFVGGNIAPNYQGYGNSIASETFRGNKVYKVTTNWWGFKFPNLADSNQPTIISFYAKVDAGITCKFRSSGALYVGYSHTCYGDSSDGVDGIISSTTWKQYHIYFPNGCKFNYDSGVGIVEFWTTTGCYYSSVKVELGTKPTDWTPAPEDVDASIAAVSTVANAAVPLTIYATKMSQLDSSISLKAESSTVSAIETRLVSAETKITPTAIINTVSSTIDSKVAKTFVTVDATGLDITKYYPIVISLNSSTRPFDITVERSLDYAMGVPSWSTHGSGFSLMCKWTSNGYGWGALPINRIIHLFQYFLSSVLPAGTIGQMGCSSNEYIYVRGGSKYNVIIEGAYGIPVSLKTTTYTIYGETINILDAVTAPVVTITEKANAAQNAAIADAASKYTTITTYNTKMSQLDNAISLKAETLTVNALTGRVASAEGSITTMAGQISSKVSTTDFNGNKIASLITQTPAAVSVLAQNILVAGAVTFSMFSSDAQGKVNTAQATADKAVSNITTLQNSLGAMAYQSMVSLAKLDTTIVEGGYIKTSLINADAIITNQLLANKIAATDITTNRLTVTSGAKIGAFAVTDGLSYDNGSDSLIIGPMNARIVTYDPYVDQTNTAVNIMQFSKSDMTNSLNRSNFTIGKTTHLGRAAFTKRGTTMNSADAQAATVIINGGLFLDKMAIDIDYGYQEITDINQLNNITYSSPRKFIIGLKLAKNQNLTWDFLNALSGDNGFGVMYTFIHLSGAQLGVQGIGGTAYLNKPDKSITILSLKSFNNQTEKRWIPISQATWW